MNVVPLAVLLRALVAAVLAASSPLDAQQRQPCGGIEHRQFDFWLGDWEVRDRDGKILGTNAITRVAACGLVESWRGAGGGVGVSVNAYDAARRRWTQRWVGSGGAILWLEGGLQDGAMVMTATTKRTTPNGDVVDRITWTPMPDGRIVQTWDTSTDGSAPWTRVFEGHYHRVERGGAP